MKTKRFLLAAFAALSTFAYAADFGGSLGTYTKMGTPAYPQDGEFKNFSLKQDEILSIWFRHNIDPSTFIAAEAEAKYRYNTSDLEDSDAAEKVILYDLKTLRFFKKIETEKAPVIINLGRFSFTDLSGIILSQIADGAFVTADFSKVFLKASANYTGLLNAQSVTILNKEDSKYKLDTKKGYYFAPAYTNLALSVEFPYLFANQTLSAECLASLGVPGIKKGSDSYNRLYGTLGLNGFLMRHLCYTLTSTIGSELSDGDGISNLTKLNFTILPGVKDMSIALNGVYASGDQMGLKPFKGFTSCTAVNSYSEPEYTGLIKGGLNFSIKPYETVLFGAYGSAVFTNGKPSQQSAWPTGDLEYYGTEAGLNIAVQIFSDLSINASLSQFVPKDKEEKKAVFTLGTNLAF